MEELLLEMLEEELLFNQPVEDMSWWQRYWWTGETSL